MICCPNCGRDVPLVARKLGPIFTSEYILYYRCTQCEITFKKIHCNAGPPLTAVLKEPFIQFPDGTEILSTGKELLGGA